MLLRPPAVAGLFYPREAEKLRADVAAYLNSALARPGQSPIPNPQSAIPKAVIAPHAGYIYSGPIAGSAFARLASARGTVRRVVLMGPAHRVPFSGIASSSADGFSTPLGDVPIDKQALARILRLPQVKVYDLAHQPEHSLETHLPFLQAMLGSPHPNQEGENKTPTPPYQGVENCAWSHVPLVIGEADAEQAAEVIEELWGGPETLICISSDLSHFLDYDSARKADARTARSIEDFDCTLHARQACGHVAINGLLMAAAKRGLRAAAVDLRNSADTAPDAGREQVVGYGAFVFGEAARNRGVVS